MSAEETRVPKFLRKPRLQREHLRVSLLRDYGIVVSFLTLFIVLSVASPVFLTSTNLLNILDQSSTIGIIACGGTLVIIAGGFDLSVGAVFAISGVVAAQTTMHIGPIGGLLAGVLTGLGCGLGNGILTTAGRINPFIATLASSIMIRACAALLTGGFLVQVSDPTFTALGSGIFLDVRYPIWFFGAWVLMTWFLLSVTKFGRHIYASGGNPAAARLSGVRVGLVRATTFAISGASAGFAGVLTTSRSASAQADTGVGLELAAIAAIVIGGNSLFGGAGAIWRTVLGVLLFALIVNGFNLLNVDPAYQLIFQGAIIVVAVAVDAWSRPNAA